MGKTEAEQVIREYLDAYNSFDVDRMLQCFHADCVFENYLDGELTLKVEGIAALEEAAREAAQIFSSRTQRVKNLSVEGCEARIQIDYEGIFAVDVPGGPKAGELLSLQGESRFTIESGLIRKLADHA